MSSKLDPFVFNITPSEALTETLDATCLFPATTAATVISPVDRFIENSNRLSIIYANSPFKEAFTPELGAVLLLGHVSAVESYLRGVVRRLVHIDEHTERLASPKELTYFAASHHEKDLLPEALLESISFSNAATVSFTLKEFCGITGMGNGNFPKELKPVFDKYSDICQLRHCCVHRFGLLGAGNAHKLGLPKGAPQIEKPLSLSIDALEDISSILQKFVLSLNAYIYRDVLERTFSRSRLNTANEAEHQYDSLWALDFSKDEVRFSQYHSLFAVTVVNPLSPSRRASYDAFLQWMQETLAGRARVMQRAAQQRAAQVQSAGTEVPAAANTPSSPAMSAEAAVVTKRPFKIYVASIFAKLNAYFFRH
jgi:hypothetical protein